MSDDGIIPFDQLDPSALEIPDYGSSAPVLMPELDMGGGPQAEAQGNPLTPVIMKLGDVGQKAAQGALYNRLDNAVELFSPEAAERMRADEAAFDEEDPGLSAVASGVGSMAGFGAMGVLGKAAKAGSAGIKMMADKAQSIPVLARSIAEQLAFESGKEGFGDESSDYYDAAKSAGINTMVGKVAGSAKGTVGKTFAADKEVRKLAALAEKGGYSTEDIDEATKLLQFAAENKQPLTALEALQIKTDIAGPVDRDVMWNAVDAVTKSNGTINRETSKFIADRQKDSKYRVAEQLNDLYPSYGGARNEEALVGAATKARNAPNVATKEMYSDAFAKTPQVSEEALANLEGIAEKNRYWREVLNDARQTNDTLDPNSLEIMQDARARLNGKIEDAKRTKSGEQRSLEDLKSRITSIMEAESPAWKEANDVFAKVAKPARARSDIQENLTASDSSRNRFREIINSPDDIVKLREIMGPERADNLIKKLSIEDRMWQGARNFKGSTTFDKAAGQAVMNETVAQTAMDVVANPRQKGIEMLGQFFTSGNRKVQEDIVRSLLSTGEDGIAVLQRMQAYVQKAKQIESSAKGFGGAASRARFSQGFGEEE